MPNNEGKACDTVLRVVEAQTGAVRADITHPEDDGIGPPVELRLNMRSQNYAIEHTLIEAFPGQIHTGAEFGRFIDPVIDELSETLPGPAVYDLYFPIDARLGVRQDRLQQLRNNFIVWVREQAQQLHERNPEKPTRERHPRGIEDQYRGRPPGFPYDVSLHRNAHWSSSSRHDGVLLASRYAPENVEEQRAVRLRTTLDRKCPKLQKCKEEGARTILVLEDNDIALSNYVLIGDGLVSLLEEFTNLPDEIYLVETSVNTWSVRLLKCDEALLPEQDSTLFDSAELIDITSGAEQQTQ